MRRGRCSLPGQIYLVTTVTLRRAPLFGGFENSRAAAVALTDPISLGDAALVAWTLMPDHLHLLLQLGDRDGLPLVVNRIKARSAAAVNRAASRRAVVWARGYHDHALRADEDLVLAARYVVANPLRAGLVGRLGDYPFWDAVWLTG